MATKQVAGFEVPEGISTELSNALVAYRAHIDALGGYGTRVRARALGFRGDIVVGILGEAGFGGCQPIVTTTEGRRFRIDLNSASEVQS